MAPITTSQQITTILAVAGFLFSFSTTVAAIFRTRKQDIQASRKELRELLERLIAIPRDRIDAAIKYKDDAGAMSDFNAICNQENTLLSRQAAEVAKKLGPKYVSGTEYVSIGFALKSAYNTQGAQEFFELASRAAVDFNDKIAAVRNLANIYFVLGRPEDGRAKYREGTQIFSNYPAYDQYTQVTTNIETQLHWARTEASINYLPGALEHVEQAGFLVNTLPYSPGANQWKMQIDQARHYYQQAKTPTAAKPFPEPSMAPVAQVPSTQ